MKIKAQFYNSTALSWEGDDLTFKAMLDHPDIYEIRRNSKVIAVLLQPQYITVVDEEADADG